MTVVKKIRNAGYIKTGSNVHSFEITGAIQRTSTVSNANPLVNSYAWDERPVTVSGVRLVPRGAKNNMPEENRMLLENNNISPAVLQRKKRLMWMQGPALYSLSYDTGEPVRKYQDDAEIMAWLRSWDFEEYLDSTMEDYLVDNKYASKFVRNRAPRIGGQGKIVELQHEMNIEVFPEWSEARKPENIYIGYYNSQNVFTLEKFPAFKKNDPFRYPVSIFYFNNYTYGRKKYSVPSWEGTRKWIRVGSDVPVILQSLDDNMLTLKYHIKSPKSYWDQKRQDIEKQCQEKGVPYKEEMLEELKDQMFSDLGEMLSGIENVGKFFDSEYVVNAYGKLEGWEIESIDMKVKDFINSQLAIAKRSDLAIASGMGLAPSLSNLSMDGNLSSGSEQLYALKLHQATDVDLPESKVTKAINTAIAVNFPNKNLKLGFYRKVVKAEDEVSPANRVTQNA